MIKSIIRATEYQLNIKWRLTNCCNYSCSYCIRKDDLDNIENIKRDQQLIEDTIPEVVRLIIEENKTTRIELIGGEVTLLDLYSILSKLFSLTNNLIKRINITSNFSRNISYYNDLIDLCAKNNVELYMIFSWHKEFTKLDTFINKLSQLKKNKLIYYKVEMVNTADNSNDVANFIKSCNECHIDYAVDADIKDTTNKLITTTNKRTNSGYTIVKENNTVETCNSIRELIATYGDYKLNKIYLRGYYCTLDYNYVYINKNEHIGYDPVRRKCKISTPLSEFHLLPEPICCPKGCSLCGHMSVAKNKEELIDWYKKIK